MYSKSKTGMEDSSAWRTQVKNRYGQALAENIKMLKWQQHWENVAFFFFKYVRDGDNCLSVKRWKILNEVWGKEQEHLTEVLKAGQKINKMESIWIEKKKTDFPKLFSVKRQGLMTTRLWGEEDRSSNHWGDSMDQALCKAARITACSSCAVHLNHRYAQLKQWKWYPPGDEQLGKQRVIIWRQPWEVN